MGHGHHHHGRTGIQESTRRLKWTLVLVVLYMVAEVIGGLVAGSLALLADAGHMLSDAGSLALALFAMWIARRPATPQKTYGYYRTEILAALAQGVALVLVAVFIFVEAWERFQDPPAVLGPLMMAVAAGGLAVNLTGLYLLHSGRKESLNLEGAWLHVMADTAGSVGAILAGIVIWTTGWTLADPLASVLIATLVLASSWRLLEESVSVLMEGAPADLDVDAIRDLIRGMPGVLGVHDLHVWTITTGMVSLSVHVERSTEASAGSVLHDIQRALHDRFDIHHSTIQLEPAGFEEEERSW